MLSLLSGGFCTTVPTERAVKSNSHREIYFISCSRKYIINILLLIITGFLATNILRLLLQRYSPWRTLASSTNFLHHRRFMTTACYLSYSQYIQMFFNLVSPSSAWSSSFPSSIVSVAISFSILWICVLSTRPHHLSWTEFTYFTISTPCNMSFISLSVIPQRSPSFTGP